MVNKKVIKLTLGFFLTMILALSTVVLSQTPVLVQRADLSINFGTASGRLVVVDDQLVFVDQDRSEDSFAIARNQIQDLRVDNDIVVVMTRAAIRARGEDRTQFSFRLREGNADSMRLWATSASAAATPAVAATAPAPATSATPATAPATSPAPAQDDIVYNVKHNHKIGFVSSGSCTGKLIINADRVVYESLENREHTRQWPLVDIKKVNRKSPYQIEIEPFNREKYSLTVEGKGIDISVHKQLMDRISVARQK